jgi:hypothetical protein
MKRFATFTAVLALTGGMAFAQDTVTPGAEFMLTWDLDGDGQVTLDEARERRDSIFYMFDLDGDGLYSADEIKGIEDHKALEAELGKGVGQGGQGQGGQGQGRRQAQLAPQAQANTQGPSFAQNRRGNQGSTFAQGRGRGHSTNAGANGRGNAAQGQDCNHTQGAFTTPQGPGANRRNAQGFAAPTATVPSAGDFGTAAELLMFDTNGDGVISSTEFTEGTAAWLTQRDRNGDGVITSQDFGRGN